jgi:hypothetical protein
MRLTWYQRNDAAVIGAMQRGERPDMATTMNSGPLDELVALHDKLGIFDALDAIPCPRQRHGVDDKLLLRTAATLPFIESSSLSGAAGQLFGEPAILLHLGWSPVQISMGDNERHHRSCGRLATSLPCHPDTLRDGLRRVEAHCWQRMQESGVKALFDRKLVQGGVYAIDGTGLDDGLRLVCLVCVSALRPVIVAWRVLTGDASEKGKEAAVTRSLIEQARELGGPSCIELLLLDALYADGPLLAWLKYACHIDALVPLPSDREMHRDLLGLAAGGLLNWEHHSYVHTVSGHKERRTLQIACQDGLTSWDSFMKAAHEYGAIEPCLWGCLIQPVDGEDPEAHTYTLVSTRAWPSGSLAFQAYRPRWHVENDAYRELKEGWKLEAQLWGRDLAMHLARITLTCLAFNTAQVYLTQSGKSLAAQGIRRLHQLYSTDLGHSPVVIYIGRYYAVVPVERLLEVVGFGVHTTLRPRVARSQNSTGPPCRATNP